ETPVDLLGRAQVTPTELFFVRCHGAAPSVAASDYRLTVGGEVQALLTLTLAELREHFPTTSVTAALTCAGNRRRELEGFATGPSGLPWGAGAIGNAVWTGVRLADVLRAAGIGPDARHVAFTGLDEADAEGEVE